MELCNINPVPMAMKCCFVPSETDSSYLEQTTFTLSEVQALISIILRL